MNENIPLHHERIEHDGFAKAVAFMDRGDASALREHVSANPELLKMKMDFQGNYFNTPTLLEFVAENPVRHDSMPTNAVEIAKTLLDLGAKNNIDAINSTLGLVCSGRVAREHNHQLPLINLLCDYGADPGSAVEAALGHGEFAAIDALIARGLGINLTLAAGTGRTNEVRAQLGSASDEEKRFALAVASQHGHNEIVSLLLDHGIDPDQHNPPGAHAFATPLHLAVLGNHLELVKLFVSRGARLDLKDTHHDSTPHGWAHAMNLQDISDYFDTLG